MKRRSFIKGTALGGVGISSFSTIQEANKKSDINSEFYVTIDEQKEVIRIIVSHEQSELVFETMYLAGQLDKPGKGIMFMSALERVATYIPDDVFEKLS